MIAIKAALKIKQKYLYKVNCGFIALLLSLTPRALKYKIYIFYKKDLIGLN